MPGLAPSWRMKLVKGGRRTADHFVDVETRMAIQAAPVRIENNVVSGANATRVAGRGAEQVMGNVPGGAPWRQVAGMMGEIASWLVPSGAMGVKVVPLPNV